MSSDAELDAKLTALLRVMISRLPPNKKLPAAVVQQLLRSKYGDVYSDAYITSHDTFIADTILKLSSENEKAAMAAAAQKTNGSAAASSSEDDSDDESSEDSDEESSDVGDDEEDEEASAESDDEEDEDDDELDSEEDSEADDDEAPERKKARPEELEAIARKERDHAEASSNGEASPSATSATLAERCKAMAECLRKLTYRVRAPTDTESLEEYLQNFLVVEFEKHGMDPTKYSKTDIKRYRIKREVELLQQDGASMSLDRRNRAGRGFSNVDVGPNQGTQSPPASNVNSKQTSMFLDDE